MNNMRNIEKGRLIIKRIIEKYNPSETRYIPQKYTNPNYKDPFQINQEDFSSELWEKMEENKVWYKMHEHVSQETYTARLLIHIMCKKNIFHIQHLILELENRFSSPKVREELVNHFCKFKQTYWAFTKLARIWKIRNTPIRIQTDLYMNELDPSNKYTYQLIHPSGIYLFSLQNLARIIVDAITHQTGMFVEPLTIKNPYTNGLLTKCDLYNIYLYLRQNNMRIHEMLEKFFRCEFNVFEFRRKHETELRDLAIEQYAKTASISELAQDVDDMLRIHKMIKRIKIEQGFPQKILVQKMRPFLRIYLLERYSFSSMTRKYSANQLDLELKQFAEKNPIFGRRMTSEFVAPLNSNPFSPTEQYIKQPAKYITDTVSPNMNYCKSKYMETHIYDEYMFDRYIETGDSLNTYMDIPTNQYQPASEPDYTFQFQSNPNPNPNPFDLLGTTPANIDPPHTMEQLQENTIAILSRLGRLSSVSQNNIYINNNIINNTTNYNDSNYQTINRIENEEEEEEEEENEEEEEENEEEEEEEEEVIQNAENESDSDEEWVNQLTEETEEEYEDEEDSIS